MAAYTTGADFIERARRKLAPADFVFSDPPLRTDFDLNPGLLPAAQPYRRAAVLCPLLWREGELVVLLTLRPDTMPSHAGQVAFPGGKVDALDASGCATALREAHEEIGLEPSSVDVLGQLDDLVTGTGFKIGRAHV